MTGLKYGYASPVYSDSRKKKRKGQRKWPDVIKLKACGEHRPLAARTARDWHATKVNATSQREGLGAGGGGGNEVKRRSEQMKWDDI